ncbi:NAD-dependent dehydratase, partial [Micromonospora purpureochromogenes]
DPARARELLGYTAQVGFLDGVTAFATDPLRDPAAVTA